MDGVELTPRGRGCKKSPGSLGACVARLETLFPAVGGRRSRGSLHTVAVSRVLTHLRIHSPFSLQIRIS